jgi:hypothetical protein
MEIVLPLKMSKLMVVDMSEPSKEEMIVKNQLILDIDEKLPQSIHSFVVKGVI